jgi:hypothetical protein
VVAKAERVSAPARLVAAALVLAGLLGAPAGAQGPASMPQPPCAARRFVPPLAPDSIAEAVLDSLGTVGAPSRPGVRYLRNLIAARFDSAAPQAQRQAAVDRVCGLVVGGDHSDGGVDGYYLVRLRGAESVSALDAAADAMRHMPGVSSAQTLALRQATAADASVAPSGSACADGSSGGWLRVAAMKEMIASRNADEVHLVNAAGLAGVDTSTVQVVADGAVCGRVAAAIKSGASVTLDGTPFLVLRAGPRYVAFDPRGINRAFFLVDTSFVFRTVLR